MQTLRLALDWTANTNHTGFFVALEKGFYSAKNIELIISTPATDNYAVTPAKKLERDAVDLAIVPSESVLSLFTKNTPVHIRAIAALLQRDMSAIVTLKSSGIDRPKLLDGRIYASYNARYEDKIVEQMVRNDGGSGAIDVVYPEKLGIWETIVSGKYDATWIFTNWEGVEAQNSGIELNYFTLSDYDIPYGYSPVLVARDSAIIESKALYTAFLSATRDGFLFAQTNPEESTAILRNYVTPHDADTIDLLKSQQAVNDAYGTPENWGMMTTKRWEAFINWLFSNKLIDEPLDASLLFTNELIDAD